MMMTDDGVDAETSLSSFLSLFISISLLRLFSRAHYWVNKYILFYFMIFFLKSGSGHFNLSKSSRETQEFNLSG